MIIGRHCRCLSSSYGRVTATMLGRQGGQQQPTMGRRGLLAAAAAAAAASGGKREVVGFVGVGNMGSGMIGNLAKKGFPLALYDASEGRAASVRAAILQEHSLPEEAIAVASTIPALAARCGTVCASLPSESVGEEVFFHPTDGLLSCTSTSNSSALRTVIDHGTVSVAFTRTCRERFSAANNITYLDAPVSGGPEGAKNGTLSIMVGGTPEVFNGVRPLLEAMGSLVVHAGPSGAGTAAKLVNQLLTGVHVHAAAEAYALAKSLGINDTRALLHLLERSWGHSTMLQRCGGALAEAESKGSLQGLSTSGAPIRNFVKDFGMIAAAAKGAGLSLPLTTRAQQGFQQGVTAGMQDWDIAATVRLIEGFDAEKAAAATGEEGW